ncbi:MAG: RnfABCDGE type electron transport complex subunit D [Acholeplasmataceae bacterium]|nr:RnfABCDGE type electron transport complex subunit D [Acholeplasmataceae bacterium]
MQAIKQTSPYVRKQVSTKRMMIDVLIALIPVVVFSIYRFGWDAVLRIGVSLVIMIGLEALIFGMMQKVKKTDQTFKEKLKTKYSNYTINNVTAPAVSAIIFAMLMPSKLPVYAVAVGAIFAIVVVKMMFGGLGANIFNVAAAGRRFISLALTGMFAGVYVGVDAVAGATPLTALKSGMGFPAVLNSYPIMDLITGNIPGTMGEISAIAILIGLVYLLIRRTADYRLVLSTALTFIILISLIGIKVYPSQWFEFVLYNIFSGGLLFGLVFMVTDPVTAPITRPGRWLYGLLIGSLIVLIRTFGAYAEGVAAGLLFANMFVPLIDYPKWSSNKIRPRFVVGYIVLLVIMGLIVYFGAGGTVL